MKGHEIRALRTRLGLTQKALAERVEVSPNTVARWERDELGMSAAMTDRIRAVAESLPSGAAVTRTSGVVLDPHHRAILDGLNDRLDAEAFEQCAVELLQADWPGLVPVRGGRDDGFDGAVTDRDSQEPFPLVVTTGKKFVENFRTSLDSAKHRGWNPERALFATSRHITPDIRRKLFAVARERGVTLVQTYDQDWFAGRLYREPEWCKRLLGITGRPHALSVFPVSRRSVLGDDVLGREREKKWILDQSGDCLLVGEPGSGKTFLLRALALEGRALFLVDEDREQIANDLRSLEPEAIIVDDAHVRPTSIGTLAQLRSEVHADFRIVATCWPGEANDIRSELHIGQSDVLTLDLLDADTMIEIIKAVGIQGPRELLYAIRSQAAGRPGLAATLAHLCLIGDIRAATSGEGLVDSIASSLGRVLDFDAMRLLAPFALGGDAGVRQEDVAQRLSMSLLDASSALAKLAAAGIVRRRHGLAISVEPPPMRWVLVRRVFFGGPESLPVEHFLPIVRDPKDALRTLIGAHARGGDVPDLQRLLEEADSEDLWADYAWLGPDAARYVLTRHSEIVKALAKPALVHLPEKAIPMLLSRAEDECAGGAGLESALDPLKRWIEWENSQGSHEAIERRVTLLRCTEVWWRQCGNTRVSIAAMCIALDPDFDFLALDPGIGTHITISRAMLGAGVINPLAANWPAVMTVVNEAAEIPWSDLLNLVAKWFRVNLSAEDESRDAAHQFRLRMLTDLAPASRQYPGVQHCIAEFAGTAGADVETKLDEDFECLYPPNPYHAKDLHREHERLEEKARQLARRWSNRTVDDLADFLGRLETEARRVGIAGTTYKRLTPEFCRVLVKVRMDPDAVATVFMGKRLPADLVDPFLRAAVDGDRPAWSIVSDCLNDELYLAIGTQLAICHKFAPQELVSSALKKIDEIPRLLEHCCASGNVTETALSEVYRHLGTSAAVSAAIGHWQAHQDSRTQIPLDEAWRGAILRSFEGRLSDIKGYWIGEILKADEELAFAWLIGLLKSDQSSLGYTAKETAKQVISTLNPTQRIRALAVIQPGRRDIGISDIVRTLVGNNPKVYLFLLQSEELRDFHLSPLSGEPNGDWRVLATHALDRGYSCEDVVDASLGGGLSWQGNESDMWADRRRHFEKLQDDDDSRVVEVGKLGVSVVAKEEQRAKDWERQEAVYGRS